MLAGGTLDREIGLELLGSGLLGVAFGFGAFFLAELGETVLLGCRLVLGDFLLGGLGACAFGFEGLLAAFAEWLVVVRLLACVAGIGLVCTCVAGVVTLAGLAVAVAVVALVVATGGCMRPGQRPEVANGSMPYPAPTIRASVMVVRMVLLRVCSVALRCCPGHRRGVGGCPPRGGGSLWGVSELG